MKAEVGYDTILKKYNNPEYYVEYSDIYNYIYDLPPTKSIESSKIFEKTGDPLIALNVNKQTFLDNIKKLMNKPRQLKDLEEIKELKKNINIFRCENEKLCNVGNYFADELIKKCHENEILKNLNNQINYDDSKVILSNFKEKLNEIKINLIKYEDENKKHKQQIINQNGIIAMQKLKINNLKLEIYRLRRSLNDSS